MTMREQIDRLNKTILWQNGRIVELENQIDKMKEPISDIDLECEELEKDMRNAIQKFFNKLKTKMSGLA